MSELSTPRLRLRQWRASDFEPFAALNADPRVMEFMPGLLSAAESDALARRSAEEIARLGFGFWATELRASGAFIGFVGLHVPSFEAPFTPCIEIGWRLERASWGNGFATEAAGECLRFAFESLALEEVVAFTVPPNLRSGDLIVRVNDADVDGIDALHRQLARVPPDSTLTLHIVRRTQLRTIALTVREPPS